MSKWTFTQNFVTINQNIRLKKKNVKNISIYLFVLKTLGFIIEGLAFVTGKDMPYTKALGSTNWVVAQCNL